MLSVKELKEFEEDIANTYESGAIKAPVHLRDGKESQLIEIVSNGVIGKVEYVDSTGASD